MPLHVPTQVPQTYPEWTWRPHFDYLLRFFRHKNYHQVDGCPVFGLHSLNPPAPVEMLQQFREWAREAGFAGLQIIQTYMGKTGRYVMGVPAYSSNQEFAPWADGVQDFGWANAGWHRNPGGSPYMAIQSTIPP